MVQAFQTGRQPVKLWLGVMVVLFCLILPGICPAQDNEFYFVQITDTHLGIPGNKIRTEKIVTAVNKLPMEIACVVHTGDIIDRKKLMDEGTLADAVRIFKGLNARVHFLPGNNDINLGRFTQKSRADYERYFGRLVSRFEYQGVVFVFAYTDPLRESIAMAGYDPLGAVKAQLDAAKGKPVILFHHGPSVDDFYNNRFHGGWAKTAKENWVKLINQYNVKAVITGHFHRDEFHWLGKVPLYVSPPVAGKWGRQACFRIYEYQQDGKIGYTTQYLE